MSFKMIEAVRDCLQVLNFAINVSSEISMAKRIAINQLVDETLDEILAPRLKRNEKLGSK